MSPEVAPMSEDVSMKDKSSKMSKEELQWQAEDDYRTLSRAMEIARDKDRYARAVAQAKKESAKAQKAEKAVSSIRKTLTGA